MLYRKELIQCLSRILQTESFRQTLEERIHLRVSLGNEEWLDDIVQKFVTDIQYGRTPQKLKEELTRAIIPRKLENS